MQWTYKKVCTITMPDVSQALSFGSAKKRNIGPFHVCCLLLLSAEKRYNKEQNLMSVWQYFRVQSVSRYFQYTKKKFRQQYTDKKCNFSVGQLQHYRCCRRSAHQWCQSSLCFIFSSVAHLPILFIFWREILFVCVSVRASDIMCLCQMSMIL
jgi:hypothetical protein